MPGRITAIPATINRHTAAPISERKKRLVAAYARVSTDHEEQLTSYEAQVDYYTNYIKNRDDWEFAGIYTDEGVTGCNTRHREGFKRMVADALAGKIQLIVTKSVSRFARNTVDSLTTIRTLKEHGVECYFEKEAIWTFDSRGELLLTIMSSLAQEESRSISENCIWGQRKRFSDGKYSVPFSVFLGYDRGPDGEFVVNEEQAAVVRKIYALFLQGRTFYGIAKILTEEGIPTPAGKRKWHMCTVKSILQNEKYKGDALLQKGFTESFLTKKYRKNEGQIQQYYVDGGHPAIISPEVFDRVQTLIAAGRNRHGCVHAFSGMIKCGDCGSWYGSKVWHSNDKYRRVVWQCNHKFEGEKCSTPHLDEDAIKRMFVAAINILARDKERLREEFRLIQDSVFRLDALTEEASALRDELAIVVELTQKCISENARIALDQTEYWKRYDALVARYDAAKARLDAVETEILDKRSRQARIEQCYDELDKLGAVMDEFREDAWHSLVDYVTVYSSDDVRFTFKDGTEIKVE